MNATGDRAWTSRLPPWAWAAAALLLLLLFNALFTEHFLSLDVKQGRLYGTPIDILDRATPVLLVSLGMMLVIGTGGIDLSVGAVMAIAGAVTAGLIARPEYSVFGSFGGPESIAFAVAVAVCVAALAGLVNGVLVAGAGVQPIVATLVLLVAGRGVAQLLTGGQIITADEPGFRFLGNGAILGLPVPFLVGMGGVGLVAGLARGTALGLLVEAVGENPVAARHAGLRAGLIKILAYVMSGLLAGVAGVLVAADVQAADVNKAGLYIELDAILAVVIGGTALTGGRFSLVGTVVGALIIQTVTTTVLSQDVPVEYTLIVKAAVVLAVCLLQSERFRSRVRLRRRSARTEARA